MEILILHQKLTEDEINLFQDHIDDFFEIWVELFGEEGLSNYIHLLAAGHISWKNIIAFTCIVNRGGRHSTTPSRHTSITTLNEVGKEVGKRAGEKSFIFPLVRYILRDLLWKTGDADRFFVNLEENYIL